MLSFSIAIAHFRGTGKDQSSSSRVWEARRNWRKVTEALGTKGRGKRQLGVSLICVNCAHQIHIMRQWGHT